jgi:MarR family transcriptional regulator, multiple antibiotic resistance protein MarR
MRKAKTEAEANSKPLRLPGGDLYLMTEIVRHRERKLTDILSRLGLTLHEWRALRILSSFEGEVPMSVLSTHSQTDRTALSRTIDRLVQRGWASRVPDPDDKRAVYVRREPESQEVFAQALALVSELDEGLIKLLNASESAALNRALGRIAKSLQSE